MIIEENSQKKLQEIHEKIDVLKKEIKALNEECSVLTKARNSPSRTL
jgi:archaellum component FlaC